MTIKTLTVVENTREDGKLEYSASGSLPLDDAARALVVIAFQSKEIKPTPQPEVVDK